MTTATHPTINVLVQATSPQWLVQALDNLDTILLDHSHCELKAANNALNLMFRYPSYSKLIESLTAIAQEELEHFSQVNKILAERQIAQAPLNAPPYAATLKKHIRSNGQDRFFRFFVGGRLN